MAAAAARWACRTPRLCLRPLGFELLLLPLGRDQQRRQLLHGASKDSDSRYLREYFYYVDQHGQLFLEETKIRNFTTCTPRPPPPRPAPPPSLPARCYQLTAAAPHCSQPPRTAGFKDVKFLDFFFSRLRPNDTGRLADRYPFVSPCGREMNYVAVEDVPVVFKTLTADGAPTRPAATTCCPAGLTLQAAWPVSG